MKKIIKVLFFISILITSIYAHTLSVIADNNNSLPFQVEKFYAGQLFKDDSLHNLKIDNIIIHRDKGVKKYDVKKKVPRSKKIQTLQFGLLDTLEQLLSQKYKSDDIIVSISSMDYIDRKSKTDAFKKVYNDAWITSDKSPLYKLIKRYPNSPLSGVKIIILDPNKDIYYLHKRERFFSYLFAKLGAELIYYGSTDKSKNRLYDYISSKKNYNTIYQTTPLREEKILMLDDDVIQYELP